MATHPPATAGGTDHFQVRLFTFESWRWINPGWWQLANVIVVILPATILFAWVFFWFCEKPFMMKSPRSKKAALALTPQPSAVGD